MIGSSSQCPTRCCMGNWELRQNEVNHVLSLCRSAIMGFANVWYSHPRKYGPGSRYCRVCSNHHGIIRKYGLNMCRQCFRQYANDIGFKKLD
ncbi:40S ribosomal protein S29 [Branchiostoma floridae]|uniref:Small ribosomal subunit protein uS14 n=1 Tax=Branchiostoma floridae TaxID=7739 RepID=A0A9J7LB44_BRAFL|nr:40S ribosomal protein S29 [Branchiostoma floridae]